MRALSPRSQDSYPMKYTKQFGMPSSKFKFCLPEYYLNNDEIIEYMLRYIIEYMLRYATKS